MKTIQALIVALVTMFSMNTQAVANIETKTAVTQFIINSVGDSVKKQDIVRIVDATFKEASKHKIDPFLIIALISAESTFKPNAKNKSGASGLTQVVPKWHKDKIKGRNIMHIETNIEIGTAILVDCLKRHQWDVRRALRCYSGGAVNYTAKLKHTHTELLRADIMHRYKNDLPFVVVASFDKPNKFSIPVSAPKQVANLSQKDKVTLTRIHR